MVSNANWAFASHWPSNSPKPGVSIMGALSLENQSLGIVAEHILDVGPGEAGARRRTAKGIEFLIIGRR
jgi:hypothetical protein